MRQILPLVSYMSKYQNGRAVIGFVNNGITATALFCGDCRDVLPTLGKVDHVISDPPYEKEAHRKDRRVMRKSGLVAGPLSFGQIEDRDIIAAEIGRVSYGWAIVFCQAEGYRIDGTERQTKTPVRAVPESPVSS